LECSTKIRYRQEPNPSTMKSKDWKIFFSYDQNQRWVAKGQSVVAYLWDECLWGGIIE
jgi:tRNA U34 2-thiouridine synthase MnmA/TrmU